MGQCTSAEQGDYVIVDPYDGDKFLGYRHGEGTYHYSNGDIYKGQWKWDKKHGHGVYTRPSGKIEGYFYEDEYIGQDPGKFFAVTSCFSGCNAAEPLESDKHEAIRDQEQSVAKKDESKDREKWKETQQAMREKYKIVPKSAGHIQDPRKHGEGTYLYENGDMYKGEWKCNKKHGHGVYTHVNGEIKQGYFYQNEYIGQNPGYLFAATSCFAGCSGKGSEKPLPSDEEIRNQERLNAIREREEQRATKREERQKRRDEMRQKYNI